MKRRGQAQTQMPRSGQQFRFRDLVPRCDLGVNQPYIERCYAPLTETQANVLGSEGIFAAQLSPTQRAIMSPWMLAQRTTPEAYENTIFPAATFYLDHWLALVDAGIDDIAGDVQGDAGAARDAANRALIFSREIDPVWGKIDGMLAQAIMSIQVVKGVEICDGF